MSESLQSRVRSSVRMTMMATFASAAVQATTMVVLARLLGPVDYGFFILAISINGLSTQFVTSATERAMVIEPDARTLEGRSIPTMLFLALVAGTVFAVVAIIKQLTGWNVQLGVLAIVMSGQAMNGLAVMPRALLRREIRFGPLVASELTGLIVGNLLTAAVLGWLGFGAYALALAAFMQNVVSTVWMLILAPRGTLRPRFGQLGGLAKTLYGVMKPSTLEAVNGQVSPLVVSSVLGPVSLGLFNRVYNLTTLPIQLLVSSVNRVIISTLVSVSDDAARLRRATELMVRGASAMVTPLAFGLAGAGVNFTSVVLGAKWTAAIPIVPFLAIAAWGNMLGSLFGQLLDSVQRFNAKARIQAISTTLLAVLLLASGAFWGLLGVSVGAMLAGVLFLLLYIGVTADIVATSRRAVLGWLVPGAVAGAACFVVSRVEGRVLPTAPHAAVLVLQIVSCGAAALFVLITLDRETLMTFSRLLLPTWVDALATRLLVRPQQR
jgi:O-antigen/teichoic acid export membrane protein